MLKVFIRYLYRLIQNPLKRLRWSVFSQTFNGLNKCQKIGDGRGLGQITAKNLLALIIPDKLFGTKWIYPVKLDKRRKVWYLFLRVF